MAETSTRREFLKTAGAGLVWSAFPALDFGPYRVGLESYCFHDLDLDAALARIQSLGLKYVELHDGHLDRKSSDQQIASAKVALKAAGINAESIYIHDAFTDDETTARPIFEFAGKTGFRLINGGPSRQSLPLLNRLIPEYGVGIAIHNHGPGARYETIEDVTSVLERYESLSACVDIGHFARSGVDPARAVRALGRRTVEVHIKDIRENKENIVVGRGTIDMPAVFAALKDIRFDGLMALEYEGDWDNLEARMKGMHESLRNMSRLIAST